MDFINDVDFKLSHIGREIDLLPQLPDIIHAGIGRGIDFYQVQELTLN